MSFSPVVSLTHFSSSPWSILLQQKYGLIRMPGSYIISAYPVILKASDIVWTAVGVALVGYLIALLPSLTKTTDNP